MAARKSAFETIVDQCARMGWQVRPTRRGWQITAPGAQRPVTIGGTGDDRHGLGNAVSALNRAGGFTRAWESFLDSKQRAARRACVADQARGI